MGEFISAFLLVFIAELGDKTQLLAFAFASSFSMSTVLLGVFIGAALNHGAAILFAVWISNYLDLSIIKIISAILFIVFSLWSFYIEFDDDESETKSSKSAILTVASAFFFGEFGDKTQLTAMTIGAGAQSPLLVLAGTSLAMVAVSSIGIIVGKFLEKKVPEITMRFISGVVFMYFGISALIKSVPKAYLTVFNIAVFVIFVGLILYIILKSNIKRRKEFYIGMLNDALSQCKQCKSHNSECTCGLQIESISKQYIGEKIPYLGKVIPYLEQMGKQKNTIISILK